jgi:hypothetical protein
MHVRRTLDESSFIWFPGGQNSCPEGIGPVIAGTHIINTGRENKIKPSLESQSRWICCSFIPLWVCVCVRVSVRERERERQGEKETLLSIWSPP